MNFAFSDEQTMLRDALRRALGRGSSFETREARMAQSGGFSRALWADFAEMGLLGLPFTEEDGGFGGGPVETLIVMEELGRALALEPYLASVVLCGGLLRQADQRAVLLAPLIAGEVLWAFAHHEADARYDLNFVATSATPHAGGFVLEGAKSIVLHGGAADRLIVSARTSGKCDDETGISLFLVDASAPGIERRDYRAQDATRAAHIILRGVVVSQDQILGPIDAALPLIERAVDEAIVALCAEAVGIMDEALAMSVDYLKTRRQFGVAIGSFQSLQHRAADMFVALESARSMALFAAMSLDEPNLQTRRNALCAAKIQINHAARFIGQQAVQLHGGIGTTMEYRLGHLFKRLSVIELQFGDVDHHMAQLARTDGLLDL